MVLLTEWPEYWSPDFELMLKQMKEPVIIDGRNVYNREQVESLGFVYYGIGKSGSGIPACAGRLSFFNVIYA